MTATRSPEHLITAPKQFPDRWRLARAGIVNVWHYLENSFDLSGGRMIFRGSNGSGKSRALELLLPFLLDGNRRRMDATGSARVSLDELMRTGAAEQTNRSGYLWLELRRPHGQYLTIGALIAHSRSSRKSQVSYFMTPLRVEHELVLLLDNREPLSRNGLIDLIGAEQVTESAEAHRDRVRTTVFGLHGDAGRERYQGLLQLLHTLRSPDVGNRIDEGHLPQILSDSLPPLGEQTLALAGEKLDGLTATREGQERLEDSLGHVERFLEVYRRYAASTVLDTAAATLQTVQSLDEAQRDAATKAAEHARLHADFAAKQAREQQLRAELAELQNAINGIRGRAIFKQADDLAQRDTVVATRAESTDQALDNAERGRAAYEQAVVSADDNLADLRGAIERAAGELAGARRSLRAATLPDGALPAEIRVVGLRREPVTVIVRTRRESDPQPLDRPVPERVVLLPREPQASEPGVQTAHAAATRRRELAEVRVQEARRLAGEEHKVREVEADSMRAAEKAETDAAQADNDGAARDEQAVALAAGWRAWSAAPLTEDLLGELDWSTDAAVGPLLLDIETLTGDDGLGPELTALDALAADKARPARDAIVTARSELAAAGRVDEAVRAELRNEQTALRSEQDPPPSDAPWLARDRAGVPLWLAVDFLDAVSDADRAGIEGALLAAGLLSASIEADGTIRADDGTVLLMPGTARPARPLTRALRADPSGPLPAELVTRVLGGIGLGDDAPTDDAPTSVSIDGHWRNGPLRGRHVIPTAKHIGAAARAEARRVRLAEIQQELATLDIRAVQRQHDRSELDDRERRIDAHVRSAPRTSELHAARRLARASADRAALSRRASAAAVTRAQEARARWVRELDTHRATCHHHDLPVEADALAQVLTASRDAAQHCARLIDALRQLVSRGVRHAQSLALVDQAARERDAAEQRGDDQWCAWSDLAAEVAAIHEAIGLDVEQARAELARSEAAFHATRTATERAQNEISALGPTVGTAAEIAKQAATAVEFRRQDMIASAQRFSRRVALPGLVAAATTEQIPVIDRPEHADRVRAGTERVSAVLKRPAHSAGANAVLSALQVFDREVSGQLDVRHTVEDDVQMIQVIGAGDDHTLAGASATLSRRVAEGRAALSEREREVFTTFVLGGVADELRRRISQAGQLVAAMNDSLRSIRTSNGIGVQLGWRLGDDDPALARVTTLVATADSVRSAAQNDELTELLRRRVEHSYAGDPSNGYAAHLASALDYRGWFEVEVRILGPEPGRQRRISKRAKLSQGETRFVSYVTLFAAADGYLSGLSPEHGQLRLILLDDAFAKVDDPTIAELMGLLVHLDLDFVMTGHALWGCFPQVPQLDVYEVRRMEGTSAVTTHVHWDGRNRHLRSTG